MTIIKVGAVWNGLLIADKTANASDSLSIGSHNKFGPGPGQARFYASLVLNFVVAFFLVLSQTPLSMAMTKDQGTPFLIEICGGSDGSYVITIEDGNDTPSEPCSHCAICYFPASNVIATGPAPIEAPVLIMPTGHCSPQAQELHMKWPEQYWSSCRGPPLPEKKTRMTKTPFVIADSRSGHTSPFTRGYK